MSDAERVSPRTAIRNWLQVTDSKLTAKPANAFAEQRDTEQRSKRHSKRHHETRPPSKAKIQHDKDAGQKHQRNNKSGTREKRVTDKVLLVNSHQAKTQTNFKENTALNSDGLGLAERLGLHAPFRTFKDHSDNDTVDVQGRPRKRRRSRASTSSYLEPAAPADLSDNDHDHPIHATIVRTASSGPVLGDRVKKTSPTMSQGSEKLLKAYERRPRHKTRQDRYELKDNNRDNEKKKQAAKKDHGEKKQKKHKRKEKSGAALMHDFAAQNVAHDRLTLKPAKTLGLFGKGRASSPVRRRGLPDLAFSEMTFLASRQEKPKHSFEDSSSRPSDNKKRRKSTKTADTEAEISRYFMSTKPTCLDVITSYGQRYQQDKRRPRDHQSPQAFVDLPDRPFLGFGSCGPNTSISPAKISINTGSRNLSGQSPNRSTSYLTCSQNGGPSYASPPPEKRHYVEPLTSSRLSNRKRTSSAPHKGQHSIPPVSPPPAPTTFSRTQSAASRPSSKHETANEAGYQTSESRLATAERLRPGEMVQDHGNTGAIELDAAKVPQSIEDLVPESTHPAEAAMHDGPESALPPRDQALCQPSGHEPRCEPRAPDTCPSSAQMPIISPDQDPLDGILEALLRECNTIVAGSDPASRARSSQSNIHVSKEARIPDRTKEHVFLPARAFVNSAYAPEAPSSGSSPSRQPYSASLQEPFMHDASRSAHTLSRESLNSFDRSSLGYTQGYPLVPTQSQVGSGNVWNGYENLYERQQEQGDLRPGSGEHLSSYIAVPDNLSDPSQETDHTTAPDRYVQDLHTVEVGDYPDDYRPYMYGTLQDGNENGKYQEIRHGERDDGYGTSLFDEFHDICNDGNMAENDVHDYQQREEIAHHEQSFAQGADQYETEPQLFATSIPDTYSSRRPRHVFSRNYGLERFIVGGQVHDVDPALSGFWTPHKLY